MDTQKLVRQSFGKLPTDGFDDQPTWSDRIPITGPPEGGELYIGIQLHEMPTDGYIAFSAPGPDPQNSVDYPKSRIANPNGSIFQSVVWPPNFPSVLTIEWWQGATVPPPGSWIEPLVLYPAPGQ